MWVSGVCITTAWEGLHKQSDVGHQTNFLKNMIQEYVFNTCQNFFIVFNIQSYNVLHMFFM